VSGERLVRAAALLSLASAVLGIAIARELAIGAAAVGAADAAIGRLDWGAAIDESRAAAEARAPWSPWPERGAERLETIARAAEARADATTALLAYGALRSASLATAAIGSGGGAWRDVADDGLARIATATAPTTDARDRATELRRELRRTSGPGAASVAALALAAAAVLVALGLLSAALATGRRVAWAEPLLAAGFVVFAIVLLMN
jgi:hypothetical protein